MRLFTILSLLILPCASPLAIAKIASIPLEQCQKMHDAGVINDKAPVPCNRLSRVIFTHINFDGKKQQGELIVLDAIAPYVEQIMQQLLVLQFPIHSAKPMYHFQGDDERSMNANNSSAFNQRAITGQRYLSLHAYGVAIDINPLQNPYVSFTSWGTATFKPLKGHQYLNRKPIRLNKPDARGFAEQVVTLFADHGFRIWGGDWDTPIDFQHFQISREMAVLMAKMHSDDAKQLFKNHVDWFRQCQSFSHSEKQTLSIKDYTWQLKRQLKQQGIEINNLSKIDPNTQVKVVEAMSKTLKAQPEQCF